MSIDDKIEHLYRENKLTEKKGNKPRKNELSYEGFTIEQLKLNQWFFVQSAMV